jgi:mannose-6-phosphate isomerase-like protein (cupin superfamily)
VVITDAFEVAPQHRGYSLAQLTEIAGQEIVSVECSSEPRYRPRPWLNGGQFSHKSLPLSEALALVEQSPFPQWHYLSNFFVGPVPALRDWLPDIPCLPKPSAEHVALFVGQSGTGAHMHCDLVDEVVVMLQGSKRMRLLPPSQRAMVKPFAFPHSCANYSSRAKLDEVPSGCSSPVWTTTISAGEAIYIPSGWWHEAVNVGLTIAFKLFYSAPPWRWLAWSHLRLILSQLIRRAGWTPRARVDPAFPVP